MDWAETKWDSLWGLYRNEVGFTLGIGPERNGDHFEGLYRNEIGPASGIVPKRNGAHVGVYTETTWGSRWGLGRNEMGLFEVYTETKWGPLWGLGRNEIGPPPSMACTYAFPTRRQSKHNSV